LQVLGLMCAYWSGFAAQSPSSSAIHPCLRVCGRSPKTVLSNAHDQAVHSLYTCTREERLAMLIGDGRWTLPLNFREPARLAWVRVRGQGRPRHRRQGTLEQLPDFPVFGFLRQYSVTIENPGVSCGANQGFQLSGRHTTNSMDRQQTGCAQTAQRALDIRSGCLPWAQVGPTITSQRVGAGTSASAPGPGTEPGNKSEADLPLNWLSNGCPPEFMTHEGSGLLQASPDRD
jgi:hypothetical protein